MAYTLGPKGFRLRVKTTRAGIRFCAWLVQFNYKG